jgi:hypothetical protein
MVRVLIVVNDKFVQYVVKGGKNENVPSEICGGRDKHSVNFELNKIRKWFKENPRAMEFASKLLTEQRYHAKNVQEIFENFLERSEPFQIQLLKGEPFLNSYVNFTRRKEMKEEIIETMEVQRELVPV